MIEVYMVYKTDAQHSYASRDLIGVATTPHVAMLICSEQATKEHQKLNREQIFNLDNIKQTQGYSGEGEFHYEKVIVDQLL